MLGYLKDWKVSNMKPIDVINVRYSLQLNSTNGNNTNRTLLVLMMNPSGATLTISDRTTNGVLAIADKNHYGKVITINVLPYYCTKLLALDINKLDCNQEEINILCIKSRIAECTDILVATGCPAMKVNLAVKLRFYINYNKILNMIKCSSLSVYVLGLTQGNYPKHPSRTSITKLHSVSIGNKNNLH